MKNILFTHSYFLRFDPKQWQIMQPYAPLGTMIAAATVRQAGFETGMWDPMFAKGVNGLLPALQNNPDVLVIYDDGFNYLTKMCLTNMREAAFRMIGMAVEMKIPVIVCSSDASDHFEKYLDHGASAVIRGEGETTLVEYLLHLKEQTQNPEQIDGLIFRKQDQTIINKPREVMKNPGDLPFPAWDLVDVEAYRKAWINKHGYFSMNMSTTRGCPFKCNWCAKPIYGNRYNSRTPENVVDEIRFLTTTYHPDHIWFCDDIFGLKPGWVNAFADGISKANLKIRYKIQSRVDLLLQENNVEALERSGCETVWVGAESGSQSVLDAMDKGTRVEQIYEATRLLKKHHIRPAFFLQFGYPGETRDDIDMTIRMVKELLPDDIGISISYPLPGTPFYEKVKAELGSKSNWRDSDELSLMFSNTFPSGFYKHLHRYVHKTYRIHQGKSILMELFNRENMFSSISWWRVLGILFHQPGAWYHKSQMQKFKENHTSISTSSNKETTLAFDEAASGYDNNFTNTETGKLQRKIVHRLLEKKINPVVYTKVLELNCGTGEDAFWLAEKGYQVKATDISKEMIRIANQKASFGNFTYSPVFATQDFVQVDLEQEEKYDVVFSNFGGLNCVGPQQLKQLAVKLNKILRPGGKFIAIVMGRKCFIENTYFKIKKSSQLNRRKSLKPVSATIGSHTFPIWYYSPAEFANYFQPFLIEPSFSPVGLFAPPSWMNQHFSKWSFVRKSAMALELTAPWMPALSDYADHYFIELTKQ